MELGLGIERISAFYGLHKKVYGNILKLMSIQLSCIQIEYGRMYFNRK